MKNDYEEYACDTGHDPDCAWVQWVCDGKYYPNPGCTCCKNAPLPDRQPWWRRIRFHAFHCSSLLQDEPMCLFGIAGGRVDYEPKAEYLYSLRLFVGIVKLEILWTA